MEDMEILRRAWDREHDSRYQRTIYTSSWEHWAIGASRDDVKRLLDEGMLVVGLKTSTLTKYRLSDKGNSFVFATTMEREFTKIPAASIIEAMSLIIGFDDLKQAIAYAIESRRRINFLLEGPPACAKSLMLEGVRSSVPTSYIAFGSRTSASGLSQALFEFQPTVLLMDEADKMHNDCYSVLLGLMETGEILETKSQKTRGIKLDCRVIAACNSSAKMPPEFLSRFDLHPHFPTYSKEEFIEVCRGFLSKAEDCPADIATQIGESVYEHELGDVRKARGVWKLMTAPTPEEIERVIKLMIKYSPDHHNKRTKIAKDDRLPGM